MISFTGGVPPASFQMFSLGHWAAISVLCMSIVWLYIMRNQLSYQKNIRKLEICLAVSLISIEGGYHVWLWHTGQWELRYSLPLELCSISLMLTIFLLLTGNRHLYDIVFFTGIAGALQAIFTPVLFYSFPHFRYFHFFYTHIFIIWTALYYTWVKGYRPTFRSLGKAMLFLNILLPVILVVNTFLGGNYMFLSQKPPSGSLLDVLGPYPWYILSLEGVAFIMFVVLWVCFRERRKQKLS